MTGKPETSLTASVTKASRADKSAGSGATKHATPRYHLKTPSLSFEGVPAHGSAVLPIVVQGAPDQLLHLEVVMPPLAPFSVTGPPHGIGRRRGDAQGAHLWIRYDARSGMAQDRSEVIVRAAGTAREWSIALQGWGHLAQGPDNTLLPTEPHRSG